MDNIQSTAPAPAVNLGDIYYTLFRHKWKIIICSIVGVCAAYAFLKLRQPPFQSEAKLFIRYVVTDDKTSGPGRDDEKTKSPDQKGETIINSEIAILTSWDLALEVAKNIGPEKILPKDSKSKDVSSAAGMVVGGLSVDVKPKSSILSVVYRHPDPEIVPQVLNALVTAYLKKHLEIHRTSGGDLLAQETDQLRALLAQTEEDLRKKTNQAGITSLDDYKKTSGEQMARLRSQIFEMQAELSERQTIFQDMTKNLSPDKPAQAAAAVPAPIPPDQLDAYQKISARLVLLRQREQEYLIHFTPESQRVKETQTQLADAEDQKKKLITAYPGLSQVQVETAHATNTSSANEYNPALESAKINALQAKLKTVMGQLDELHAEATKVDQLETSILELHRRRDLQDKNYRYYEETLEQNRISDALGTNRMSNISVVQTPTPPFKDMKLNLEIAGGLAAAGIVLGLAWGFLIELFFDRSVRRPVDVERALRLPLFLSIPRISKGLALPWQKNEDQLRLPGPSGNLVTVAADESATTDVTQLALSPYYQTLRDRLISYFDSLNVRHKPKLVAVTGLGKDSGVTTIAAGLARSFSETGEGSVLLVDMTQGQGSALHFHKGKPVCGLDQLLETRGSAQVEDNLYVVGENSSSELLAKGLPQRFNQLVPKLKASDFDYIIFDMPSVSQISITPRLASFMDLVLMVMESEKTDRDLAMLATNLLAKSKTSVGVVLNKTKSYIPAKLHQDHEFLVGT